MRKDLNPDLEAAKDRAWKEVEALEEAFERGEIDADGYHRGISAVIVPSYLAADNPRAQSGHGGDEKCWEQARRPIIEAIDRDGTFLDVGCASGLLMESIQNWTAEKGLKVEPYGLDISPELAELARTRLPYWKDRIFTGNAATWIPEQRYDFVRTCLYAYVPRPLRPQLVNHLPGNVVAPGGRLIIGVFNEEAWQHTQEEEVASWGYKIAGRCEVPHPNNDRIVRRVFWIDASFVV